MEKKPAVIKIPVRVKKPRCKEYDAAQRVLDYFNELFDDDRFDPSQHVLVFGVGNVLAEIPVYADTWEIMDSALSKVQEFFREEYADDCDFSPLKK